MLIRPRPMPLQDTNKILLHATRYRRAADAHRGWAERAKKSVDYFEGRQWKASDLAKLAREKRPALTLNKIKPLVNLVLGYFLNNKMEIHFKPGLDGSGSSETAAVLNHVAEQIAAMNELTHIDTEVFLDGLITGRGFWRTQLDFRVNDFGHVGIEANDPFSTLLDPDGDQYDLNKGRFTMIPRWVSPDEIYVNYGASVASAIGPIMRYGGVSSSMPMGLSGTYDEVAPVHTFAEQENRGDNWFSDNFYDWVDPYRKSVRLLDIEHKIRVKQWHFVDLETGESKACPDGWGEEKINKTLQWALAQGQPVVLQQRMVDRVRWTHMVGDVIAYDDWSPYESFSLTPFFPYFRRGFTQGMVEPLTDSQDEVNKRRSARLNIVGRTANGGWMVQKGSLDAQQKNNLENHGSTPGIIVEYSQRPGEQSAKPEQIAPATPPIAMSQLEQDAEDDLKQIAGINDAALGTIDTAVISGASLERRQRQTIVGLEHLNANYRRSKTLGGKKQLELVQRFYTEQRILAVQGKGNNPDQIIINQRVADGIVNDVRVGNYLTVVDETPLSKTFLEAQFEELMSLRQLGMPVPDDFIIDSSANPRKEELKAQVAAAREQQAALAQAGIPIPEDGGTGPGASKVGPDGGSLPANMPEPGAPPV